jgi:hypothetical protein
MPVAGLGINSVVASAAGFGGWISQFQNGIQYNPATLYAATLNPGVAPTAGSLSASPAWGPQFRDPSGRPARINQWNIALQRQLTQKMSLEAAYVGNRGVWEEARGLMALNAISPAQLTKLGLDLTNPSTRTLLTSQVCSTTAVAAGIKLPYAGYPCSASVAQSLRPFPEYNDALSTWYSPLGNSWYDALQTKFMIHSWHGLDVSESFTFQKELNLGNSGINDAFNRQENKGLSGSSQPFISVTGFTYMTPKVGQSKMLQQVTRGWTLGGVMRYASGALIGTPGSLNNLGTYTFNGGTRMDRVSGQPLYLVNPDCRCIDPTNASQRILNPAAWVDTPAGTWGQGAAYYNDYRWQHQIAESVNLGRTFQLREKMSLNIRAEFFNPFNRLYLPTPSSGNPFATVTQNSAKAFTSGFGYILNANTTANIGGQRNGQLVARFLF